MEKSVRGWTLAELAARLHGELRGPADLLITGPAPAGKGQASDLTFADNERYLSLAENSEVGAIIVGKGAGTSKPAIALDSPRAAFGMFLAMCARPLPIEAGIHPTAIVSPEATVSPGACVGAYVVIERGAVIADNAQIYPFAYIGEDCHVGSRSVIYPHAVLYQDVRIGKRVIIHAGSILGADGFGFAWAGDSHQKIPQVGGVSIGDDVEIGANTTVDRATAGNTEIGRDVKLDNQVMVAHNTTIGDHTVIASQTGIGGSSVIGKRVTFGGQAGVGDHAQIGDDVTFAARAGAPNDVLEAGFYKGLPARPYAREQRIQVVTARLPELEKRIKELEKRLSELESK